MTLRQTSNTAITIRNYIKQSIPCGQTRALDYDESCDLLHCTKVEIEVTAGSKRYNASFSVDLGEICLLPDSVVASSECRTQEDYHTPLVNSKATSVVMETPFGLSRNNSVADDPDATPTKRKDIYAFPVSDVDTDAGSKKPMAKESRESILQNVTNSAKRKADSTEDWQSTKKTKMVQTTYGRRHRKSQSSLSKEVHADESTDSASGKENAVTKRRKTGKAKPRDSSEVKTSSMGKRKSPRSAEESSRPKDKKAVPASQETTGSGASPLSAKGKLAIVFSGSTFATDKTAVAFLKRNARIMDAVTPQVDYLCIGSGVLKTTSKILKAVALGKPIISDEWVRQCLERDAILDPSKFLAEDERAEQQMDAPRTWSRGTNPPRSDLFGGRTIYMTPALKKSLGTGFNEIRGLVKLLGARDATSFPATDSTDVKSDKYVVLGLDIGDSDSAGLFQSGVPVYSKDLISLAILRGRLNLGDEFRFDAVQGKEAKRGKK